MVAHRLKIVIPEDHRVVLDVPEDVPAGPAELIFMVERREASPSEEAPVPESAKRRFRDLADTLAADPRSFQELSAEERKARLQRVMGVGRGLFSTSDEFARRKEEEIDLEERHLGRRG